jgi:catechol 2,3-dioxygenase-like lactoylglutathione lyase family enzyme
MNQPAIFKLESIGVIMLGVTNMDRSTAFYRDRLGLELMVVEPNLAFAKAGHVTLGLSKGLAAIADPVAGAVEIVFSVPSVETAYQALMQKGVTFAREPRQVTATDWATNFTDPDGHHLSIFGPKSAK